MTLHRGPVGRAFFYASLALVSTHCRCQYEVLERRADGSVSDGAIDARVVDAADSMMPPPPTITLGSNQNTNLKGSDIGTSFAETCPGDQVLIGLDGYVQPDGLELLTAISGTCGSLHVQADGTTVTVQTEGGLPLYGDTNFAGPFSLQCPANQVVVGFEGNAGTAVDSATIQCAPLTIQGGMIAIGTVTTLLPAPGGTAGTPYNEPCQLGRIARGRFGYYDSILEGIGLTCSLPTVVP